MAEWVSVTERLPVPREKVLVAYQKGVTIAQLDGYIRDPKNRVHYWRGMHGPKHSLSSVTHWMPMPEPPDYFPDDEYATVGGCRDWEPADGGTWIGREGSTELTCSRCGWTHDFAIPRRYCPNCGQRKEEK